MTEVSFAVYDLGKRKLGRELSKRFFDRKTVVNLIGKKQAKAFGSAGALVRTIARRSLRPVRKKRLGELNAEELARYESLKAWHLKIGGNGKPGIPFFSRSKPGEAPRVQPNSPLKSFLFFALNENHDGVVVGPAKYPGAFGIGVPKLLEFGGQSMGHKYLKRSAHHIEARPFMRPAMLAAQSKFAQFFQD